MFRQLSRRLMVLLTTTVVVAATAPDVMAFCFSNDSLSNTSFTVRQMPKDAFKKTVKRTAQHSNCNALPKKPKEKCLALKKKAKAREDQAAEDVYEFMTDLPVLGDPIDKAAKYSKRKMFEYAKWQNNVIKDAGKVLDDVLKPFSTRFRQTVVADRTQCCSWKNRDCNPSGKKNGTIYFNLKYADVSRVVKLGATDHMECTIDKNNPRGAACKNYAWPQTPPRPNEKTRRGLLIKSMNGDKCLEVGGWNKKNGANVNMWQCHGGKNQRWVVYRNGTIRSEMNSKCLDIAVRNIKSIKNGSNVALHDCHGGPNQRWVHWQRNDELVNRVPGGNKMCLDVAKRSKENDANVHVWKCGKNQANQRWTVGTTATYPRVLKVRYPGKCLDNTGGSKKGGKVHAWDCNAKNVNQQWAFKVRADNYLEIKSRRSGMCLDVAAAKKNNGAGIIQWPCNGKAHQQWKIQGVKDGWFQLRARHSGKCLDLKGPYKENGTPFQQWACKDVPQQSFRHAG